MSAVLKILSVGIRSYIHTTSRSTLNRNHASIFYRFRDTAGYLSKVADFDPPHLHLAPPQGVTAVKFRGDLWHQKTRVLGQSCGFACVILCLAILVELRLVTDSQTQTGPWLVPHIHRQHRSVKILSVGIRSLLRAYKNRAVYIPADPADPVEPVAPTGP